mmetsp:Transcript_42224/g.99128  ORF Transcript_42224/g.99128 Transcript_42224/m.99128 type:complete len:343 (+) Transcript_42224:114-1142(+)
MISTSYPFFALAAILAATFLIRPALGLRPAIDAYDEDARLWAESDRASATLAEPGQEECAALCGSKGVWQFLKVKPDPESSSWVPADWVRSVQKTESFLKLRDILFPKIKSDFDKKITKLSSRDKWTYAVLWAVKQVHIAYDALNNAIFAQQAGKDDKYFPGFNMDSAEGSAKVLEMASFYGKDMFALRIPLFILEALTAVHIADDSEIGLSRHNLAALESIAKPEIDASRPVPESSDDEMEPAYDDLTRSKQLHKFEEWWQEVQGGIGNLAKVIPALKTLVDELIPGCKLATDDTDYTFDYPIDYAGRVHFVQKSSQPLHEAAAEKLPFWHISIIRSWGDE